MNTEGGGSARSNRNNAEVWNWRLRVLKESIKLLNVLQLNYHSTTS